MTKGRGRVAKGRFSYERNILSHITTGTKRLQMSFYTFGNTYSKILISKIVFRLVETDILPKRKAYDRKVVFFCFVFFSRKED